MGESWVDQPDKGALSTALRVQANKAHQSGQLELAEKFYRCLLEAGSQAVDAANYGALLRQQGRLQEAIQIYDLAIADGIDNVSLCSNAANAYRDSGDYTTSERVLRSGLKSNPDDPVLLQGLAKTLLADNRPDLAYSCLISLSHIVSPSHELWFDMGVARSRLGNLEAALNCFEEASRLHSSHVPTFANLITLLNDLGQFSKARQELNKAISANLVGDELDAAAASLLMSEQDMHSASLLLFGLCERQPCIYSHWLNLAAALRSLKYTYLPARILRKGLSLCPLEDDLLHALMQVLAELGHLRQAKTIFKQLSTKKIIYKESHFFSLQFLSTSFNFIASNESQDLALSWEGMRRRKANGMIHLHQDYLQEPLCGRRMRIGYLSSDFCNHPVSRFLLPVLQSHDSEIVEVWGLHCGPHWDEVTEHVKDTCDHWLNLSECSDLQAARMISDQRLDVLIELGGYTGNSRLGICVHGVAPLQVSYLGYPGATFLQSVPAWLGDKIIFAHLSDAERQHRLLQIDGGYMCFPKPSNYPEVDRIASNRFRFACFNNARKITDATLELWSELLFDNPQAELVLKSISFRNEQEILCFRRRCESFGIYGHQLLILPGSENFYEHLKCYNSVDVALDPIPYGGATTTAEALWMGVPVVCLHGSGMVGALSASLLISASKSMWVAETKDDYKALARRFLQGGVRNRSQRLNLRAEISASALNQPFRVSRQIEELLLHELLKMLA